MRKKMTALVDKYRKKSSATILDRAMEAYSLKLLTNSADSEDKAEFERLSSARKKRLTKLQTVKRGSAKKFLRDAG